MSNPHPLAYIAGIIYAGLATVACIAGYLTAVAAVSAVVRWWRGGARRFDRVQKQAALDGYVAARQAAAGQPTLADLVLHPEVEKWALAVCVRCRLGDTRQPCTCAAACGEDDCLAWANAISNTEEWER